MTRSIAGVILMLIVVSLLAACGGTTAPPSTPIPTATVPEAATATSAPAPAQGGSTAAPTDTVAASSGGELSATQTPEAAPQATSAPAQSTTGAAQATPVATAGQTITSTQVTTGTGRMIIDTAKGRIILSLYTDPSAGVTKTINNFAQKANSGYFDGLTFHRVEDWVIQGGDPKGDGTGGGSMRAEYNQIPFTAGSLGVARGDNPAVNNDSQFFITKSDAQYLNGQYTNFGKVIQGMDVVNKIAIGDKITQMRVQGVNIVQSAPEPDHITLQHILIGFKDAVGFQGNPPAKAATRTQDQAKTLAYNLLNQIKAGADFNQLVTQYTDDSPPGIYGLANFGVTPNQAAQEYPRDGMVPAFGDVGFSLKVGEVGIADYDPQTSPYGYHIIKRVK